MVGFGANRRGGRLPSIVLIALMVVILIMSFNYWTVSNKQSRLLDEMAEVQTQVKRTDAARSRLEKRNSELMVQVDTHRKQIDQKESAFNALDSKLHFCDTQLKKCTDDKVKQQSDASSQLSEMQRLNEQMKDLRQEFLKQEEQLREVRKNSTYLERKLEYESLQCGRQIAQLKEDYDDEKKKLETEAAKLKQSLLESRAVAAAAVSRAEKAAGAEKTAERHTESSKRRDSPEQKVAVAKLASDAGMPGIEDSEVGKPDEVQFALKKPAITQKQAGHGGDGEVKEERAGAGAGAGAGPGPDLQKDTMPLPGVPLPGVAQLGAMNGALQQRVQQPPPPAVGDRPVLFDEDNKAAVRADEVGENRRPLRGGKADGLDMKGVVLPPPPNPAQVLPNPMEQQRARDAPPAQLPRHRQNDEDRELQGDRPVDYGKRHQAIDIL
ncbi:protein GOLM2 isoform X1 [Conger conger]|uniref:protein GOLM2 isoform X1 n=1 Tax=Conger conger TaxID=82655 RepID=UPI002A5A9A47|nr:protein GOLM2 isoform X1 [Conger conger]